MKKLDKAKRSIFGSALIVISMRWTDRLIGLVSTLILARILVPEDFGIVAMASLTVGLVDVLLDMGVTVALVHKRGFDANDFSTAWTIRLVQSTIVASIVALASPLAADYFKDPRVTPVLWLMALTTFTAGCENIGIVEFQKQMNFGRDFQFFFYRRLVGFISTVTLAFALRSYWALPLGALAARFAGVWLSYGMHPFRPRLTLVSLRRIWSFSQWMLVQSAGSYVESRFDKLLIGRRADATVVGAYSLADEMSAMPSSELLLPIGRVLFPALVGEREDPKRMKEIYLLALALQAMFAIPAATGLALVARDAVIVILGAKWMSAAPFVQVLALVYGTGVISHAAGYMLLTLGRVRLIAFCMWLQIGLFAIGAIFFFPTSEALDLARLRLAVTVVGTLCILFFVIREVEILNAREIVGVVWRPIIATLAMAVALLSLSFDTLPAIIRLFLESAIGAVIYVAVLLLLWLACGRPKGGEEYAMGKLNGLLRRF